MSKLTELDMSVLVALRVLPGGRATPGLVAAKAGIRTMSPRETAARHLIKMTNLGYVEKLGTRMFPEWRITLAGRSALGEQP